MDTNELTLGQAKELTSLLNHSSPAENEKDRGVCIVVLQRGWVAVGHLFRTGNDIRIEKAAVVRRWGTARGLGELAASGPLEDTVLDASGKITAAWLTVVAVFDCNQEKWNDRT